MELVSVYARLRPHRPVCLVQVHLALFVDDGILALEELPPPEADLEVGLVGKKEGLVADKIVWDLFEINNGGI